MESDEGSPLPQITVEQRRCPFSRGKNCEGLCLKSMLSLERSLGRRLQSRTESNKELFNAEQKTLKFYENRNLLQKIHSAITGQNAYNELRSTVRLERAIEMKDALDILQAVCEMEDSSLPSIDCM